MKQSVVILIVVVALALVAGVVALLMYHFDGSSSSTTPTTTSLLVPTSKTATKPLLEQVAAMNNPTDNAQQQVQKRNYVFDITPAYEGSLQGPLIEYNVAGADTHFQLDTGSTNLVATSLIVPTACIINGELACQETLMYGGQEIIATNAIIKEGFTDMSNQQTPPLLCRLVERAVSLHGLAAGNAIMGLFPGVPTTPSITRQLGIHYGKVDFANEQLTLASDLPYSNLPGDICLLPYYTFPIIAPVQITWQYKSGKQVVWKQSISSSKLETSGPGFEQGGGCPCMFVFDTGTTASFASLPFTQSQDAPTSDPLASIVLDCLPSGIVTTSKEELEQEFTMYANGTKQATRVSIQMNSGWPEIPQVPAMRSGGSEPYIFILGLQALVASCSSIEWWLADDFTPSTLRLQGPPSV